MLFLCSAAVVTIVYGDAFLDHAHELWLWRGSSLPQQCGEYWSYFICRFVIRNPGIYKYIYILKFHTNHLAWLQSKFDKILLNGWLYLQCWHTQRFNFVLCLQRDNRFLPSLQHSLNIVLVKLNSVICNKHECYLRRKVS